MRFLDAVDFAAEHILPHITVTDPLETIVVHPTCSSTRAGSNSHLLEVARATARQRHGAGRLGMLRLRRRPRDAASRAHAERDRAANRPRCARREFDAYVSCNRTCEIGMTRATGHPYQHVLEVLDQHSRSST